MAADPAPAAAAAAFASASRASAALACFAANGVRDVFRSGETEFPSPAADLSDELPGASVFTFASAPGFAAAASALAFAAAAASASAFAFAIRSFAAASCFAANSDCGLTRSMGEELSTPAPDLSDDLPGASDFTFASTPGFAAA
ncbi:hypothetical protein ACFU6K_12045, partial [Kitasatospora sp. NPDC057512]|uniref:hypothetical protein n=1 Tax=Kitasatospora sp. NPDC057512 TaxID=3346154 RepID=UPI003678AAE1